MGSTEFLIFSWEEDYLLLENSTVDVYIKRYLGWRATMHIIDTGWRKMMGAKTKNTQTSQPYIEM